MKKSKTQKAKLKTCAFAAAIALAAVTVANAETMWVKSANVNILEGKGAVFPTLGQIKKGQQVTVLAHDGSWVQVQSGGITGWVYSSSLSSSQVSGDVSIIPTSASANMNTGIAARGLQGDAEQYVNARHLNKGPLEHLIALRKSIAPAEYVAFTNDGKIGR